MDCNECKLEMVDLFDSDVDQATLALLMEHLLHCPDCSKEYDETMKLLAFLKPKLQPSAPSMLKQNIINQLNKDEAEVKNKRTKVMWLNSKTKKILSIAAVLILAMLIVPFTFRNDVFMSRTSKAANKLIKLSIEASQSIKSMVIKLKIRTIPRDHFDLVGTEFKMVEHTISKDFDQPFKWRIDKGEREVVCDGSNCYLWIPGSEYAVKAGPNAGFVSWLRILLDPQAILTKEQNTARERNSKITMKRSGNDILLMVTSSARGNFINDYCKNKSIEESDNRREYVFDGNTKLLKGLKIYIIDQNKETLILETESIDYDVNIDPDIFTITLPEGVTWQELTNNYDSETFKNISSKRAAELFFKGMANNNWKLVEETCPFFKNSSSEVKKVKDYFGGLTVISIGEPFKSGLYRGEFVPYEIKFKSGRVKKFNLALRNDNPNKVWIVTGGF